MLIAQPGRMGPLKLRNRIIMGPMGTNYGTTDGFSTERDKFYYGERARGGAAMIITEAMVVSGNARNHRASLCIFDDRFIPGLAAPSLSAWARDPRRAGWPAWHRSNAWTSWSLSR